MCFFKLCAQSKFYFEGFCVTKSASNKYKHWWKLIKNTECHIHNVYNVIKFKLISNFLWPHEIRLVYFFFQDLHTCWVNRLYAIHISVHFTVAHLTRIWNLKLRSYFNYFFFSHSWGHKTHDLLWIFAFAFERKKENKKWVPRIRYIKLWNEIALIWIESKSKQIIGTTWFSVQKM